MRKNKAETTEDQIELAENLQAEFRSVVSVAGNDPSLTLKKTFRNVIYNQPVDHQNTFLFIKGWIHHAPIGSPIIVLHDIGETSESYRELALQFLKRKFTVYTFDQRGHGKSGGVLGHVDQFGQYVSDLIQVISWIRFKSERTSPIIIAHGLSAITVLKMIKKMPELASGAVLLSPGLSFNISRFTRVCAQFMAEFWPKRHLMKSVLLKPILQNLNPIKKITAKTVSEIISNLDRINETLENIDLPLLSIQVMDKTPFNNNKIENFMTGAKGIKSLTMEKLAVSHNGILQSTAEQETILSIIVPWLMQINDAKSKADKSDFHAKLLEPNQIASE